MYMNLELPKQNYPAHVQSDEPLQSVPRGGLNYCNCSVRVRTAVRARQMVREGGQCLEDGARGISSSSVREDRGGFQFEFEFGSGGNCIFFRSGEGSSSFTPHFTLYTLHSALHTLHFSLNT